MIKRLFHKISHKRRIYSYMRRQRIPGVIREQFDWVNLLGSIGVLIAMMFELDIIRGGWYAPKLALIPALYSIWFMFVSMPRILNRHREKQKAGEEFCFECTYRTDQLPDDILVCPECGLARRISRILWDEYYDGCDRYRGLTMFPWRFIRTWRESPSRRSLFTREEMFPRGEPGR